MTGHSRIISFDRRRQIAALAGLLLVACGSEGGTADTAPYAREKLLKPETCGECHPDHFDEWSLSMHAYASTDPVFRAMNARGQQETNGALGDFCVKCHAPMALREGATSDGLDLDSVPQELQGVTCYFCHNVTKVTDTHNNPLVLANDVTMRGGIQKPMKYKGHIAQYSKLFDDDAFVAGFESSNLCGSCHDIVVPAHFAGSSTGDVSLERTFSEWKQSIFSGPSAMPALNCTSAGTCHMQRDRNAPIASPPMSRSTMPTRLFRHEHDFPAIDVSLTADEQTKQKQLDKVKDKVAQTLLVQVCAAVPGSATYGIDVWLENLSAGHNFPSGASQDRRIWVEIHAYSQGQEIRTEHLPSGVVAAGVPATTVEGTWILRDEAFGADGKTPAHMFWDVASLKPNTIPVATIGSMNSNRIERTPVITDMVQPDRVTVTVWVEPIGLDVIDDMLAHHFLDQTVRDAIPRFPVLFADDRPDAAVSAPVSLEWTIDKALVAPGAAGPQTMNQRYCVSSLPPL